MDLVSMKKDSTRVLAPWLYTTDRILCLSLSLERKGSRNEMDLNPPVLYSVRVKLSHSLTDEKGYTHFSKSRRYLYIGEQFSFTFLVPKTQFSYI